MVRRTFGSAALVAALLVALTLTAGPVAGATVAQEPGSRALELTPSNGSEVVSPDASDTFADTGGVSPLAVLLAEG